MRWTNENPTFDARYNTLPFDSQVDQQSYAQPWQTNDNPPIQLLSDWVPACKLYTCHDVFVRDVALNSIATSLIDQTFLCYQGVFDFSGLAPGRYYANITYTDDDDVVQSWITCPLDIQAIHPETMLYQYQNSYNVKDIIFTPGDLILQLRVEANMVGGYQPKSNRQTFDDQSYNPTLLNGIPFRVFTNYILGTGGPDWVVDKLNLVFTCDQVKIDNEFYVATNGTDFKAERPSKQLNQDGMWSIELQTVPDFEFGQLTAGTTPQGDLIVVRKVWPLAPFPNFTGNFAVNGIFTTYSTLDYLQTINYGLQTFQLLLGTTPGGNDILDTQVGTPNADTSIDLIETHTFRRGLNVATTVYCTIPDGVNIKALFIYDQLDAPPLNVTPSGGSGIPQGTVAYYKELVAGYFVRDWDIATGLGQVGSAYEGCQIFDQAAGKVLVAWDRTTIDPDAGRGTPGVGGALEIGNPGNEVTITREELPNEGLGMFTNEINNTDADFPGINDFVVKENGQPTVNRKDYSVRRGTIPPTVGVTDVLGAGSSMYIGNDGLIMLCYIKL